MPKPSRSTDDIRKQVANMRAATISQPPGQCPTKASRTVVDNAVPLPDLVTYLRAELRMSKRDARWMAREVYRDEEVSRTNLPGGWHASIWPAAVTFERRGVNISDPTPRDAIRNIERMAA